MNICRQNVNKNISIEKSQSPRGGRLCENGSKLEIGIYTYKFLIDNKESHIGKILIE